MMTPISRGRVHSWTVGRGGGTKEVNSLKAQCPVDPHVHTPTGGKDGEWLPAPLQVFLEGVRGTGAATGVLSQVSRVWDVHYLQSRALGKL